MRPLSGWTGGLVGERDPAAPLLTYYDGTDRVELSGATTANWVAKSANLLVDGLGGPDRVGLLLPLHWQALALLLAGATTGATVVVAERAEELTGCAAAFTTADTAQAALAAGVDDVLALSCTPLGAPLRDLPALVVDYAREVPSYGDHWTGPQAPRARVERGGTPVEVPDLGLSSSDRVLTVLPPDNPDGLGVLLGALRSGAGLVLVASTGSAATDLARTGAAERVTASAGADVPGARRLL